MNKEERKAKAIELLQTLDIYKPYINGFKNHDHVCIFEMYGGFWAYQRPEVQKKIKELEEKYDFTVYAITHEIMDFGECYDFLVVTNEEEDADDLVLPCENRNFYAFAYVWNKSADYCSEFGDVAVKSFGGGIARIA